MPSYKKAARKSHSKKSHTKKSHRKSAKKVVRRRSTKKGACLPRRSVKTGRFIKGRAWAHGNMGTCADPVNQKWDMLQEKCVDKASENYVPRGGAANKREGVYHMQK